VSGRGERARERERDISHLCVYSLYSVRKAGNRETGLNDELKRDFYRWDAVPAGDANPVTFFSNDPL